MSQAKGPVNDYNVKCKVYDVSRPRDIALNYPLRSETFRKA